MKVFIITAILILLQMNYMAGLTKEESIELAIRNNLGLQSAAQDIKIADAYYREVRSSLFPQLQLTGGYQLSRTELPGGLIPDEINVTDRLSPEADQDTEMLANFLEESFNRQLPDKTQDETNFMAGIKLDQVVYLGGKLMSGIKAAGKYKHLEATRHDMKKRDLIFETIDLFYQGLMLRDVLEINREALQLAEKHYERVAKMFEQGLVSEFDKIRAELEKEKRKPELQGAENRYHLWQEAFIKHLGLEQQELHLDGEITMPETFFPSLEDALAEGVEERPELFLSETARDMYELQYRAERGNYLPNVALSAEVNTFSRRDEFDVSPDEFGTSYQVMLGLQMPIFTGFGNRAKIAQARHELRKAEIDYLDLQDMIELDIRSAWQHLDYAGKNIEAQQKLVELAEKGLAVATARYDNQVGIHLEVLDAQLEYNLAQVSFKQGLYEVNVSQVRLRKAMGLELY